MGRFYKISCGSKTWSSQRIGPNGSLVDDPAALDVEFDFNEGIYGIPADEAGGSTLTIHGVSLEDLQQAQNFATGGANGLGQAISVQAGMSAGFPLAKPQQRGLILQGSVLQSFGNWTGTEMTLDFVVAQSGFTMANPGNFVFNWQPGTSLQDALTQTVSAAYAKATNPPTPVFLLAGHYAPQPNGHLGRYSTLKNLAAAINSMTKAASPDRRGVFTSYASTGNAIVFLDAGGSQQAPLQIAFTDLIGQPTWIESYVMQFTTVLRADIQVGSIITMPQGLTYAAGVVTTTSGAFSNAGGQLASSYPTQLKYKSAFQGTFIVQSVRQIGRFRDPDGASWATVISCAAAPTPTAAPYPGGVS